MAFKANDAGFKKLAHSKEVANVCKGIADRVAARAKATGPVDSGDYVSGIHAIIEDHPSRVTAQVVASDPKSLLLESLTGNLAKALNGAKR